MGAGCVGGGCWQFWDEQCIGSGTAMTEVRWAGHDIGGGRSSVQEGVGLGGEEGALR